MLQQLGLLLLLLALSSGTSASPAPAPVPSATASRCRLLLRGSGSSAGAGPKVQQATLACSGPSSVRVGVNSTHLGRFADGFTGVAVDKEPCAAVKVPAAYDFLADEAAAGAVVLQPLLCFPGNELILFEQLDVAGISLDFAKADTGHSTALLAFAGSTSVTILQGRIADNSAGPTLLLTGKADVTLAAGTRITGNSGITGAAIVAWGASRVAVVNSTLARNRAQLRGGAVYAAERAQLIFQDSLLLQNSAELHGGAVFLYDGVSANFTATNCSQQRAGGYGGCMETGGTVAVVVTGGTWAGNQASWGACFDLLEQATLTTRGGFSCSNNTASGGNGGAGSLSGSVKANVTGGSVFAGNKADAGGAFYAEGDAALNIEDGSQVVGNKAVVSNGGGLWIKGSATADLTDSACDSNQAAFGGCVALWESAAVSLSSMSCSHNTARQGGCGFMQGSSAALTVEDSSVDGNRAVTGGAFQAEDSAQLSLAATKVAGNAASVSGGGIYLSDYSFLDLGKGVTIHNNTAGRYGGAATLISNNVSSLAALQQAAGASNTAPSDASLSVLTTNLTLLSPENGLVNGFVSRLGSEQGVLWVRLAVSGWFGLPCQGVLVQAALPASNNEIIGVNRSAADGSVQLGIKLRRPPGCHNISLTLVEMVDLAVLGVGIPPVSMKVCVRECLPGEISTGDACETCRPGTYSLSPESGPVCFACPSPGAVCPGGDLIVSQDGWWHSSPASAQLHMCRNQAACGGNRAALLAARTAAAPCPPADAAGSGQQCLQAQAAAFKTGQCSEGYQGNLCGACAAGNGLTQPFTCLRCLPRAGIVALYVMAAVLMLAVMKLQVHWLLQERKNAGAFIMQDSLQPTTLVKLLVLFCQYQIMVFTLNTAWPASLAYPLQKPLAWLWSSTTPQALSMECVLPNAGAGGSGVPVPVARVLFYLLMPVGMVLVLFIIEAVTVAVARGRGGSAGMLGLQHRLAGIAFVVIFFYFPSIVRTILSLFACVPLDEAVSPPQTANSVGSFWLWDMNQQCWAGYHRGWSLGLGLPLLLLVCVALPASILVLLLRHQDLLYHSSFASNYGYLYRSYRERCCWFEAVWIVFTIVLGTISVFGYVSAYMQALLMLLALAGMWVLLLLLRPYAHAVASNMALLSIACLLLTSYAGLLFLPNRAGSLPAFASSSASMFLTTAGSEVVGAVVLLVNLLFVCLVLVNLVRVVRWREIYSGLAQLSTKLSGGGSGSRLLAKRGRGRSEAATSSGGRAAMAAERDEEVANSRSSSANSHSRLVDQAAGGAGAALPVVAQHCSLAPADLAAGNCKDPWARQPSDSRASSSGRSSGGFWVGRLIAETPVQQYRSAAARQHRAPPLESVPGEQALPTVTQGRQPSSGAGSSGYWGRLFGQRSRPSIRVVQASAAPAAAPAPPGSVPAIRSSVVPAAAASAAAAAGAAAQAGVEQPADSGRAGTARSVAAPPAASDSGQLPSFSLSHSDDLPLGPDDPGALAGDDDLDSLPTPVPLSSIGTPLASSHRPSPAGTLAATSGTFASLGPTLSYGSSLQPAGTPRTLPAGALQQQADALSSVFSPFHASRPAQQDDAPSSVFSPFHAGGPAQQDDALSSVFSPFHAGGPAQPPAPPAAADAGGRGDSNTSLPSPFFS